MSRKTCALALIVLTIALILVPGVYAEYPIEIIDVQKLPDTMIAGNSYKTTITFDNVAEESVSLTVEMTVTSEPPIIGDNEIFIDEIKLNGIDLTYEQYPPGVFTTVAETVDASSQNELSITLYTAINLMPGTYNFDITLMGEEIEPENEPPVAVASATTNYLTVTFDGTGSSDPDGTIESYSWDFGDKTPLGTGSNPIHTYSVSGTYTVTLTVTDNDGLTDSCDLTLIVTRRRIIILRNINPNANAGRNRRVHVGQLVEFSGVNSTDPDGTILSYEWDFGDGAEASGVNASHRYLMADNYTVTLTVVDNRYGEDTDTCTITVEEIPIIVPPLPPYLDNLNVTPAVIELGDSVTISFDIRSLDSQSIDYGVDIYVEDVNVTRIWVDLGAYEFKTISHTITPDTVGTFNVTVHGMTGNFTVEAPEIPLRPAEFVVSDLIITPEEVEPGDEVTISVLVTNIGEETGDYTVTLDLPAGPFLRMQETVSLEGGESERVEFEVSRDIEGVHAVTVEGLTGSFTVEAPPRPAEFVFSDLRIFYPGVITPEVEEGETVTVAVSVEAENVGELMGSHTVELKVNESAVDSQELTLEGGASVTVLFELERGEGTYQVEVEGMTDSFTVVVTEIPPGISVGYFAGVIIIIVVAGVIIYLTWKGKLPTIYTRPE